MPSPTSIVNRRGFVPVSVIRMSRSVPNPNAMAEPAASASNRFTFTSVPSDHSRTYR